MVGDWGCRHAGIELGPLGIRARGQRIKSRNKLLYPRLIITDMRYEKLFAKTKERVYPIRDMKRDIDGFQNPGLAAARALTCRKLFGVCLPASKSRRVSVAFYQYSSLCENLESAHGRQRCHRSRGRARVNQPVLLSLGDRGTANDLLLLNKE